MQRARFHEFKDISIQQASNLQHSSVRLIGCLIATSFALDEFTRCSGLPLFAFGKDFPGTR